MSLEKDYHSFLNGPSVSALAEDASIAYIPTLTNINTSTAIVKHLNAQEKQLNKKSQKFLSAIESSNGLCAEIETTIEFTNGGGVYLPGLDDTFLADRIVTFPMVHIVSFDDQRKIQQIRLYWDQGSLLKATEVIGARGKNWPVRDGKDQLRLIVSGVSTQPASRPTTSGQDSGIPHAPPHASSTSATNDPHATLSLFQNRNYDEDEQGSGVSTTASVPTRESVKPPTRDLTELLASDQGEPAELAGVISPESASRNGVAPKGGAGKHFSANRLFDENDQPNRPSSPEKLKTNPKKYNHFEFGD
ncbi:hypothetical protein LTS18_011553, partial [Coniosporium uncinatum]